MSSGTQCSKINGFPGTQGTHANGATDESWSLSSIFLYHVGLSSRIDCCTTNNNYQHLAHQQNHNNISSKLQLLNYNTSSTLPGDQNSSCNFEGQKQPFQNRQSSPLNPHTTTSTLSRRPSFTLQSPLQHRSIQILRNQDFELFLPTHSPFLQSSQMEKVNFIT